MDALLFLDLKDYVDVYRENDGIECLQVDNLTKNFEKDESSIMKSYISEDFRDIQNAKKSYF